MGGELLDDLPVRSGQFRRLGGAAVPAFCSTSFFMSNAFWSLSAAARSAEWVLRRGPRGLPDRPLWKGRPHGTEAGDDDRGKATARLTMLGGYRQFP